MFGRGKKENNQGKQPDIKVGGDFKSQEDFLNPPKEAGPEKEDSIYPLPKTLPQDALPEEPDPVGNLQLPDLPEDNPKEAPGIKAEDSAPVTGQDKSPLFSPTSFVRSKGPVFISVRRYKEVISSLNDLKYNAGKLREIIASLKETRDSGTDLLSETAESLSSLEQDLDKINASIRA